MFSPPPPKTVTIYMQIDGKEFDIIDLLLLTKYQILKSTCDMTVEINKKVITSKIVVLVEGNK